MRKYLINTGWLRAEPGKQPFLDAWASILNSLVGAWGQDNWEWETGKQGLWRMVKGACFFSIEVGAGDHTIKLPFPTTKKSVLICADTTNGSVRNYVILPSMEAVAIHLDNESLCSICYDI